MLGRDMLPAAASAHVSAAQKKLHGLPPSVAAIEQRLLADQGAPSVTYQKGKVHGLNSVVNRILARDWAATTMAPFRPMLAILDDRHFPTWRFWDVGLPILQQYEYRFVQFAQQFVAVMQDDPAAPLEPSTANNDTLDTANGMYFFYGNLIRNVLHAVASCGTNALWTLDPFSDDHTRFSFSTETYIEDTETSHEVHARGEKSFYVADGRVTYVRGIAKPPSQYATALQRWSFGALQMFTKALTSMAHTRFLVPFVLLLRALVVGVLVYIITSVADAPLALIGTTASLLVAVFLLHTVGRLRWLLTFAIMYNDITYWISGLFSPVVWIVLVPVFSFTEGESLLLINMQIYVMLMFWSQFVQWAVLAFIKGQGDLKEAHIHNARMSYYVGYNIFLYNITVGLVRKLLDHGRILNLPNDSTWVQRDVFFFWFIRVVLSLEFLLQVAAFVNCIVRLLATGSGVDVYSPYFIFAITFFTNIAFMVKPVCVIVFGRDITFGARHVVFLTTVAYLILYFDLVTEWSTMCYFAPRFTGCSPPVGITVASLTGSS